MYLDVLIEMRVSRRDASILYRCISFRYSMLLSVHRKTRRHRLTEGITGNMDGGNYKKASSIGLQKGRQAITGFHRIGSSARTIIGQVVPFLVGINKNS